PDAFAAALLNAQPMGFYAPAQIVRDAREHGVEVRPPDVNFSDWDSTLEPCGSAAPHVHDLHADMRGDIRATHAIRLGLREIKGLKEEDGRIIMERRAAFTSPRSAFSLPSPLWGGSTAEGGRGGGHRETATPLPNPPPQGGREH